MCFQNAFVSWFEVVMMRLFCAMVDDDLSSTLYDAQLAGLDYKIEFSDHLQFSVSGFHDKLPRLLTATWHSLA